MCYNYFIAVDRQKSVITGKKVMTFYGKFNLQFKCYSSCIFVILIGYVLRQTGMLNENFIEVANKFNFKVTLPVLLFSDIGATNIIKNFDGKFVLFCAVVTSICFWTIWFLPEGL